jgi:nitrogen fixation/metabolism regulation signal transduction histidine kinase
MIYANISIYLILLTVLLGTVSIFYCHNKIHQKSSFQFRSLSNLLEAMNQGDYSVRARASHGNEALNELVSSINTLSIRLNKQRIDMVESQLLLNTVISHIDVAIIALNNNNELVLTNPAANSLLKLPDNNSDNSIASFLQQLSQIEQLASGQSQVMSLSFTNNQGQFNVHREAYRQGGKQQTLLFITDVSTMLRIEERKAWQSLVRVISHEINNSLAPIASISQSLTRLITRPTSDENPKVDSLQENKDFLIEGLAIVSQRASNLAQFVNSYKQISSLPEPNRKTISIVGLVNKVIKLYAQNKIQLCSTLDVSLSIDAVQFEQVLINIIKNSVEATAHLDSSDNTLQEVSKIFIDWQVDNNIFTLTVSDNGTGISNLDNLFVPFYTTKKSGSGIGLVLSRQIIEGHGGKLTLKNKTITKNIAQEPIQEVGAQTKVVNLSGSIATIELPF